MTCVDENHKKLDDAQLESLIKDSLRDHEKSLLLVQNILHTSNYCETEFMAVMVNVAISVAINALNHLQVGGKFTKSEAMEMVLGGIASNIKVKLCVIDEAELLAKVRQSGGVPTH